jgi:chemotaxis protein MotB
LTELKKRLDAEITSQHLQTQVATDLTEEGLQVQFSEGILFASGEATINSKGAEILQKFLKVLSGVEQKFHLAVEGHTDNRPIHTAHFPSNWELSSARSVNVLHFIASQGLDEKKMMVRAYADTRPITGQAPSFAQNRRVTILVY